MLSSYPATATKCYLLIQPLLPNATFLYSHCYQMLSSYQAWYQLVHLTDYFILSNILFIFQEPFFVARVVYDMLFIFQEPFFVARVVYDMLFIFSGTILCCQSSVWYTVYFSGTILCCQSSVWYVVLLHHHYYRPQSHFWCHHRYLCWSQEWKTK